MRQLDYSIDLACFNQALARASSILLFLRLKAEALSFMWLGRDEATARCYLLAALVKYE
jgi:hypothetical protein